MDLETRAILQLFVVSDEPSTRPLSRVGNPAAFFASTRRKNNLPQATESEAEV
jgi:hypothetical protein